ncbi:MAG: ThiF family adenylyltransferase [Nitrososphaerota archaeon]
MSSLMDRYDRQIIIEGWDQNKVSSAKILIVGVGATGCEVAKNLALVGIGKLILVDMDVIELSNLSRQMLFHKGDIGKPKAEVAKKRIKRMNPYVKVESYNIDVHFLEGKIFEEADVICSCVDNWPTRRWLNSLAVELNKPLVDGAMEGFYGNVQVVIPGVTSCIECHGENLIPNEVQLAECTLKRRTPKDLFNDLIQQGLEIDFEIISRIFNSGFKTIYDIKYASIEHLKKIDEELKNFILSLQEKLKPKLPALQTIAATIAGIQSQEVLKIIHKESIGEIIKGLLVYDSKANSFTTIDLEKNENCFVCGKAFKTGYIEFKASINETILDLKERIAKSFSLPDPEIQYKTKLLRDHQKLSELDIKNGDYMHINTTRRFTPLTIKIIIED